MGIRCSFLNGNPEDRDTTGDFWSWLKEQPQQAWLYYARVANWDQADGIFLDMIADPRCDRALASWLFWSADPSFHVEQGCRPRPDTIIGAILDRMERGGFASAALHYDRREVANEGRRTAAALKARAQPLPWPIPRELCANFDGTNADLPAYGAETEHELAELFEYLNGKLPRTDAQSLERHRASRNWTAQGRQLPQNPLITPDMSDVAAIEAVFGKSPLLPGKTRPRLRLPRIAEFVGINLFGLMIFLASLGRAPPLISMLILAGWIGALVVRFAF